MIANLVLTNGRFYTMDRAKPFATAVAIREDKIIAVGTDAQMQVLLMPDGELIDLQGATVTPGLVDAHAHFQWYSLTLLEVDVYEVPSLEEAQRRVAEKAAETPVGGWVQGRGWKNQLWPDPRCPLRPI